MPAQPRARQCPGLATSFIYLCFDLVRDREVDRDRHRQREKERDQILEDRKRIRNCADEIIPLKISCGASNRFFFFAAKPLSLAG